MLKALLIALLALAGGARAYVTSAVLEFSADDGAEIYLNGKLLLSGEDVKARWHAFNYEVLSTSDGTLPLSLFNMNGENVLAVDNFDMGGGSVLLSYRLTVRHSGGDPVVVWSEPGNCRFLHLPRGAQAPKGWFESGFNDAAWEQAREARIANPAGFLSPELKDPSFGGFLGSGGYVPFVSHRSDAQAPEAGIHNFYRSRFRFPNQAAKPQVFANPRHAAKGEKVALRLLPGPDSVDLGPFHIMAPLPAGMKLAQASPGATWDQKSRRVVWAFPDPAANSGYVSMNLASVIKASGWDRPDKALGPHKKDKDGLQGNISDLVRSDAAYFFPGDAGWFKASEHALPAGSEEAVIRGVIFRFQLNSAATSDPIRRKTDQFVFNYSVDGSETGALKNDAEIDVSTRSGWHGGYYDASEDRKWNWAMLKALKVKIDAVARLEPDKNGVASCEILARYYLPAKSAPTLYYQVEEPGCKELALTAMVWNRPSGYVQSDPVPFKANPRLCPTPAAPLVAAPTPQPGATPGPTPDTGLVLSGPPLRLGCLQSAPEPFKRGGVFVYYCVKVPSKIAFKVYTEAGKPVRSMPPVEAAPGNGQIFYNGLDDAGAAIRPGRYRYEVEATAQGRKEVQHSTFTRVKDAR